MKAMPVVNTLPDGGKQWSQTFEEFTASVYVPACDLLTDVINYGFRAPYLLVFEETHRTTEKQIEFADHSGLSKIAASFGGSVVFIYPTAEGGWENAPADLFASVISESRISQYYKDGAAIMWDRFNKCWGDTFIRGAVLRTCLYGFGKSADYVAKYCLQTIEGDGLYGKGDITPACCILQNLSEKPVPQRRDIPVVSIGNSSEVNDILTSSLDHVLIKESASYEADYHTFIGSFRRMMGNLEREDNLEEMGMAFEPGYCTVTTSADNRGDDKETKEHKIGYVAYYNKDIMKNGNKVPLVMCFHGGGDSAMCMSSVSGWYRVAAKYHFLLVCVENHLNSTATETIAMIEQLKEKYSIDTERIYSTGFSMGGCKSWDMFQEYPAYFAAVAPMDATFEVGQNAYGNEVPSINRDTIVPVFYVGGEITPLPELPFQEAKCTNRMAYTLKINQSKTPYDVTFEERDSWKNPIWGIDGDVTCRIPDPVRNSVLTLHLFESKNGCCYSIFGCVSGQGHEVRHHTCENAWKFLSQFRRLSDGTLSGGLMQDIENLYA